MEDNEFKKVMILAKFSEAYGRRDYGEAKLLMAFLRVHYPDDAAALVDHMSDDMQHHFK